MKHSTIKCLKTLVIALYVVLFASCSKNDDAVVNVDNTINVQGLFTFNIDENPTIGQSINIINATSNSALIFTILEQTIPNALAINPNTGELKVADTSFFDFETNPIIQGVVEITNGVETVSTSVRVNLNNKDDIEFLLTDSKQAYLNAQAGTWIEVTAAEYDILATRLNEVSKVATSDADYDNISQPSTISTSAADNTIANDNGVTMPSGSYLFAFKYISGGIATTMRAKQSSVNIASGYQNVGNIFPMSPVNGTHYLVLKTSTIQTTAEGYLALYSPVKSFRNYPSAINNSGVGDTNLLPDALSNNLFLYQGLSSTQRQWD